MYCSNCGNQIDNDANFCAYCGTRMQATDRGDERKTDTDTGVNANENSFTTLQMTCKVCNAGMRMTEDGKYLECPYCGAREIVIDPSAVESERIRAYHDLEEKRIRSQEAIEKARIRSEEKLRRKQQNQVMEVNGQTVICNVRSNRNRWVASGLCLFLGYYGVHRFYAGKIGTGILWLFTGGLFGVGWCVDLIRCLCGRFEDNYGRRIC